MTGIRIVVISFFTTVLQACGGGVSDNSDVTPNANDPRLTRYEKVISASAGGRLETPNGAVLEIPPGSLKSDTKISISMPPAGAITEGSAHYKLEPDGLTFAPPAKLTIPYENAPGGSKPFFYLYHISKLNPVLDAGSELTNWQPAKVVGHDAQKNLLTIELDHFSYLHGMFQEIDELAYLVIDMPGKYLKPADLIFTLTDLNWVINPSALLNLDNPLSLSGKGEQNWAPGHVGIFDGAPVGGKNGTYKILESTNPEGVIESGLHEFKNEKGHLFLGPRRPSGGLTPGARTLVMQKLRSQLGKGYSTIGQGNLSEDAFSCVGYAENGLEAAGAGVVPDWREALVSTPLEMFRNTVPVTDITEHANVLIDVPVYGVTAVVNVLASDVNQATVSSAIKGALAVPLSMFLGSWGQTAASLLPIDSAVSGNFTSGYYQKSGNFTIEASGSFPEGATFSYKPDGNWHFEWTPKDHHAGKTFYIPLQMNAVVNVRQDIDVTKNETLKIEVLPLVDTLPTEYAIGSSSCDPSIDSDQDGINQCLDCNDGDATKFGKETWFKDSDDDGASTGETYRSCLQPTGYKRQGDLTYMTDNCPVNYNPDQLDEDNDGIGNPCDEDYAGNVTWYRDTDGDGYSDGYSIDAVTQPGDHFKKSEQLKARSGDCNDNDASINPGATEINGNGIDENCDGSDGTATVGCSTKHVYTVNSEFYVSSDPAGHAPHIGMLGSSPLSISTCEADITISGNAPFVSVEGTIGPAGNIQANGSGTVAGYPDITVGMTGTFDGSILNSSYTMGSSGGLPSGVPIVYGVSGAAQ